MSHQSGTVCFSQQSRAIEYAKSRGGLKVFSQEFDNSGRRYFIVASEQDFFVKYQSYNKKNHYEVITNGSRCKLYLDLEFPKEENEAKYILTKLTWNTSY